MTPRTVCSETVHVRIDFVIPTAGLVLLPLIMHRVYGTHRDHGRKPQLDLSGTESSGQGAEPHGGHRGHRGC